MLTLRTAYERYHRSVEHSQNTIDDYRIALKHWERLTPDPDLNTVTNETMASFREQLLSVDSPHSRRPLAKNTVAKYLREIQAIFATIGPIGHGRPYALGLIDQVPVCRKPKIEPKQIVTASNEEIDRIYEACSIANWPLKVIEPIDDQTQRVIHINPTNWWRALLVYIYNVGSRRNEFLSLRKSQVDLDRRRLTIDPEKHGSQNWKPIPDVLLEHLDLIWHNDSTRVFACSKSRRILYSEWYRIQAHAGIKLEFSHDQHREPYYWFHEIRKTCGTNWSEQSPVAAQHMLGHKNLRTTMTHYVDQGRIAEKVQDSISQPASFLPEPPDDETPQTLPFRIVG